MADIRALPAPPDGGRVETGPVQFGDDWPGVFIRGDNAGALVMQLTSQSSGPWREIAIKQLAQILSGAVIGPAGDILKMQIEGTLSRMTDINKSEDSS